jgi:hypothetical protein
MSRQRKPLGCHERRLVRKCIRRMHFAKRLEFMLVEQMTNYFKMCRCHCLRYFGRPIKSRPDCRGNTEMCDTPITIHVDNVQRLRRGHLTHRTITPTYRLPRQTKAGPLSSRQHPTVRSDPTPSCVTALSSQTSKRGRARTLGQNPCLTHLA